MRRWGQAETWARRIGRRSAMHARGYRQNPIAAGINPDDLGVPDSIGSGGTPGPKTRDAIMLLLNAGRSDALRAAIAAAIRRAKGDANGNLSPNDEYHLSVFE